MQYQLRIMFQIWHNSHCGLYTGGNSLVGRVPTEIGNMEILQFFNMSKSFNDTVSLSNVLWWMANVWGTHTGYYFFFKWRSHVKTVRYGILLLKLCVMVFCYNSWLNKIGHNQLGGEIPSELGNIRTFKILDLGK